MRVLLMILLSVFCGHVFSQETQQQEVEHAKDLGFVFGASYSNMRFDSKPYFLDTAGTVGRSDIQNALGISGGICYYIHLGNHFMLRPGVELNIMSPVIQYDTEISHRATSAVFPLSFEIPIALVYSVSGTDSETSLKKQLPEVMCGFRPVFTLPAFVDLRPEMKTYNLNVDLGLGFPFKINKRTLRTELFYSYGINNLIGSNDQDVRTYSVNYLGRSYSGIRLLFN